MRKAYIFVYSDKLGTRKQVINCLDKIPQVLTWRWDLPNSFYVISDHSADDIVTAIREVLGSELFFVSEISPNKQGWLPEETWYLINSMKHKLKKK